MLPDDDLKKVTTSTMAMISGAIMSVTATPEK